MRLTDVIVSQYLAALAMLKAAITRCPESLWDSPDDRNKFWHVAYHALFYTHLYLADSEETFRPWARHRPEHQFLGQLPWPPHDPPRIGAPYDKDAVLEYLAFCEHEVADRVPRVDMAAASGFDWLPLGKLELQLYSIRHIQQHTGELMERLGARAGVDVDWVGRG